MSDNRLFLTRRLFIKTVPLGIAGTIILKPQPAEANWGMLIFRVGSYGLGAMLGVGLAVGVLALGTVGVATGIGYGLYSAFRGNYHSYGYGGHSYAAYSPGGWKEYKPPKPIVISVSFKPTERIAGDVLRLRAIEYDILKNDGVVLPRGGKLVIEEDGMMNFADTRFRGYARMQNNSDLSVWTPDNRLVLTRTPRANKFHNLHHDSDDGRLALVSLLGDISHA